MIDKSGPVLVTGATGYVAGWVVKRLLDDGITVHAAVRDPNNGKKLSHLKRIADEGSGKIRFFKSDLLQPGSYREAMEGCKLVFHTASPFAIEFRDAQKELIEPAVKGTENVLNTASEIPTVKRVVVTSSCAAIYTDAIDCQRGPGGMLNESFWNESTSLDYQPYSLSKTLAEKKAWELAKGQSQWDLVTINPSLVMGPPLNPKSATSESINLLKQLAGGTARFGVPNLGIGMVDVRDVAEAHFRAGYYPNANGRYITSGHNTTFLEVGQVLIPKYGRKYPLPKNALPKWLVRVVGPLINKQLNARYVNNNVNVPFAVDNSRIRRELGIEFRPMQQTMEEAFQAMIDAGAI